MNEKLILTTMGDLKETDKVLCTDGKWHNIKLQDIHLPEEMYRIWFKDDNTNNSNNLTYIDCSCYHEWTFVNKENKNIKTSFETQTIADYSYRDFLNQYHVGTINGPFISKIEKIDPSMSRCILVKDSDDHQFCILRNEEIDRNNIVDYNNDNNEKNCKYKRDFSRLFKVF